MIIKIKKIKNDNIIIYFRDFSTGIIQKTYFTRTGFFKYIKYVYSSKLKKVIKQNLKNLSIREFYVEL